MSSIRWSDLCDDEDIGLINKTTLDTYVFVLLVVKKNNDHDVLVFNNVDACNLARNQQEEFEHVECHVFKRVVHLF